MTSSPRQKKDKCASGVEGFYTLEFQLAAMKEYERLEKAIQLQLLKKLCARLAMPKVQADKLRGMPGCYKLKLRAAGVRMVYEVIDKRLVVSVITVGRRDNDAVYHAAKNRLGLH